MLACDASHPFSGTKETFPSRFRSDSFMTESRRDLAQYDNMFTESEVKDMSVKTKSSPPRVSRSPSPISQPTTEVTTRRDFSPSPPPPPSHHTHPPPPSPSPPQAHAKHQHQRSPPTSPEVMDKHTVAMTTNATTSSPPSRHSPVRNSSAISTPPLSRNLSSDPKQIVHQLLRHQQQQQQHDDGDEDDDDDADIQQQQLHQQRQLLKEHQELLHHHHHHQQRLQQSREYSNEPMDVEDLTLDKGGNYSDSDSSGPGYNSQRFRELMPETLKDNMYWEKRRRNNEAARRSREKRRVQDNQLEGRICTLESDNGRLRRELSVLKKRFNLPEDQLPRRQPMDQDVKDDIPPPPPPPPPPRPPSNAARMPSPMPTTSSTSPSSSLLSSSLSSSASLSNPPSRHSSSTPAPKNNINSGSGHSNRSNHHHHHHQQHQLQHQQHHHPHHPIHNSSSVSRSTIHVENTTPYTSPPPLLTVAGAIQMGMAVYPSPGPALPYFFAEASRMNQELRGGGIPHGIPSLPTGHPHINPAPVRRNATYPPIDVIKQEKPTSEDLRIRERSNSNILDHRPSYQIDHHHSDVPSMRRGSMGNFVQYGRDVSPSIPSSAHPAYPVPVATRGSNPGHFLQRAYDSTPYSQYNWSQRSPASSHSSDDYEEPLQLTVRRDSNLSTQSTHSSSHSSSAALDDANSRESEHVGSHRAARDKQNVTPGSPPASSFPLKLRHKLPSHDVYSKDVFPSMSPSATIPGSAAAAAAAAAAGVNQPSFPPHPHPFINGLAHLSEIAMAQNNPLSLIKKDNFRQRRDSTNRAMARRNPLDQKYMDPKYLERRRRNNEAARKCRENRKTLTRIREVKSDYLENENNKLRDELNGLQEEMKQLRELIEKKRIEKGLPIDDLDQKPIITCDDMKNVDTEMYAN